MSAPGRTQGTMLIQHFKLMQYDPSMLTSPDGKRIEVNLDAVERLCADAYAAGAAQERERCIRILLTGKEMKGSAFWVADEAVAALRAAEGV